MCVMECAVCVCEREQERDIERERERGNRGIPMTAWGSHQTHSHTISDLWWRPLPVLLLTGFLPWGTLWRTGKQWAAISIVPKPHW